MKTSTSAANFLRKLLAPLCAAILPALLATSVNAQTVIANYNFNSGTSDATLVPALAPNITSTASNTEAWVTYGGVVSGSGAFASNATAGNARGMANSSGTNTKYYQFVLGGSDLPKYSSFGIYFQAQRSGTGAQALTVQYNLNNAGWTTFPSNSMAPGNGSFTEATFTLPASVLNATSLGIRILASGASGTGTLRLDNFQIRATSSDPTINTSGTLLAFSTTAGTASQPQSFTATGSNLTENITVTAPADFEVATDGATFGDTVTITQSSGSASGTVSVRIKASATAGSKSGTIVLSSAGATSVSVPVSGLVESASAVPIVTSTNFIGQVAVAFSNSITASGAPTNFVISSGTLPGGLSLNAVTGLISGTPTNAVTNNVSVTAQNANGTSDPATIGFAIAKGNQTITFAALPTKVVGDADFTLSGTASSGLLVSYSSSSNSVATVTSNIVTIVGAGSTVITASQAGDDNWNAATNVTRTLTVLPNNIAYWNFDSSTPSVTPAGWSFGAVIQGNNNGTTTLFTASSTSSGYTNVYDIPASGGTNAGAAARTGAINTNTSGSAYFEFSVTAPIGNTNVGITNISFGSRSTSTGPQGYSIRSSANNFATDLAGGSGTLLNSGNWILRSAAVNVLVANGATQIFRIYGVNGTGSPSADTANWRVDDLTVGFGALALTNPSLTLTPSALAGLSTFAGTPSAGSSYALVGTNLTNDVVITPTTPNLEISTNNFNFTNELTLPLAGGAVSNTTLFVRISAAAPIGALSNAAVRHISTGLTNDVTVAGNVYDPSRGASTNSLVAWDAFTQTNFGPSPWAPTLQASNLIVSNGLTRGTGVLTSGGAAARGWGGVDWSSPDASTAVASNKFATFTVAATNGYALSISAISRFDYRRSSSGPSNGIVQAKVGTNDFANVASVDYANSANSGASIPLIDLSTNAALQNVAANTPVTFRIVNFGGTNTTGTWYVYDVGNNPNVDFEISGSVVPASTPPAPSGLSYTPSSANGVVGTAITSMAPSVTGTVTNYAVSPALPAGLSIDSNTGVISGTPSAAAPAATYTVTASNAGGSTTATVTIGVASAYQGWLNGQPQNSTNQLNYAIGGASNALATNGVAPTTQISATDLSITAIVRTNDTNLSVFGQSIVNLATGTWGTNDVTRITNGVDQTGVPSGNQRQIFSTPRGVDGRKFLRLQTTLSNQ